MTALIAGLSSLFWGSSDFLGGTLSRRHPVRAVVAISQSFGLLFMVLVVLLLRDPFPGWSITPWAVIGSACGLLGLVTFYAALAIGTMSVVSPVAATGVVVPLLTGALTGDLPSAVGWAGAVLAIVGLMVVLAPEREVEHELSRTDHRRSVGLAFIAALGFGGSMAAIAQGAMVSTTWTLLLMRACSVVVMLLVLFATRTRPQFRGKDLGLVAVVGVFDVSANLTFGWASSSGQLVIAAVLGSLYPIVTVWLAWWVHGERLRRLQYLGVAVALLGVGLMSVG